MVIVLLIIMYLKSLIEDHNLVNNMKIIRLVKTSQLH